MGGKCLDEEVYTGMNAERERQRDRERETERQRERERESQRKSMMWRTFTTAGMPKLALPNSHVISP